MFKIFYTTNKWFKYNIFWQIDMGYSNLQDDKKVILIGRVYFFKICSTKYHISPVFNY